MEQTCFAGKRQGSTFKVLNKHNKQSQWICESLINRVTCSSKTEPKVAKKFKGKSSIPAEICLSKNDDIQIHQYIGMSQDLNPNLSACSSLVIFMYWACKRHLSIFLVLRSESSSGKCAKFHTVVASKNNDHPSRSLYYCLFAAHIFACCSLRTSRSWWITHSSQH